MGYIIDYRGDLEVTPAVSMEHRKALRTFFKRRHSEKNYPSAWCDFAIDDTGRYLYPLDGRTYNAEEWIEYLLKNHLGEWGYSLNGVIIWRGEDTGDAGSIRVSGGRVETHYLWDEMDEEISDLPHRDVPNPIKPLDWENDEEYRDFDIDIRFNKPILDEHAKWLNSFARTIHYARRVDENRYGRGGELFLEPIDMDNSTHDGGVKYEFMTYSSDELICDELIPSLEDVPEEDRDAELERMRIFPAGDCPDLFCQWTASGGGLSWDGGINFSRPSEWLEFLIRKFLAPNGYVLNGKIRWNGSNDFYDRGTIFVRDNRVSAYLVPFPTPTEHIDADKVGAY